jgi:TrmH family RNA methyltransferase
VQIIAAHQNAPVAHDAVDWKKPSALLVGSEGQGLPADLLRLVHATVKIPMKGKVESLNVATAAAVCLFEAARQRR